MDSDLAIVILLLAIFSIYAYIRKKVNKEGIFLANIVGLSVFRVGNITLFITLLVFFGGGVIVTNLRESYKTKVHGKRTTKNILANMGLPTIFLLLGSPLLFLAGLSASFADTLSSEIGLLSKARPRLITTFEKVNPGRNGAVTMLGLTGGLIGAFVMAEFAFLYFGLWQLAIFVLIAGLVGTIFDSILGATLERKKLLDNAHVNTLSTFAGGMSALMLTYF